MNNLIIIIISLLSSLSLFANIIPYSQSELKTESNHFFNFVRISPDDSLAIPMQTDVWLWHDTDNLHILLEAEIDENFTKGKLATTDEWIDCDFFRIQIITDVKNYYAYMFCSFPFGNQYDGIRKSDLNIDTSWNSNYKYENNISSNLWKCTMVIPFKDLRFYGKPPYEWKIILTRYFQKEDAFYSFPYGTINMGKDYFRTANDITINEELAKNKNYKISPYFVKKYDLIKETDSFDPKNVGLDFSYNPNSAAKMKFSINPDFSDVPMDNVQDNFNIRYAPSYAENRYFFIEDLDAFGVSSNLFYSRHIMQPQYAVKLTGNSDNFSYGFLSAMDKKVSQDGEILNNDDIYNMFAFKPKWENLSIQITFLNRMNKDYHNEVIVINPVWEFIKNHSIKCEINATIKNKSEIKNKKGYSLYCEYYGKKGDINWSSSASHKSKDYNADMGLVHETDFTTLNANIWQNTEPNSKFIKMYGSSIWLYRAFISKNNDLLEQNIGVSFRLKLPMKINLRLKANIGQENYNNTIHTWDSIYTSIEKYYFTFLNIKISYSFNHTLFYNLYEVFKKDYLNLEILGDIGANLSYNVSAHRTRYFNFPSDSGVDDKYWIANSNITIIFSNNFSLTNGFRFNTYESTFSTAYIGIFSNLSFEFKENCNLYLGFKTVQDEIEQKYITDYKQAYLKLSYTF